ncbi:hypothetical protein N9O57_02095 [bacterium]|nr:hypothetical protein [bacterium]
MKNTQDKRKCDAGQSTIEFIVTFSFVVGFIFLFIRFSVNMTNGFLVHYGTYMASRAYLSFENNSGDSAAVDAGAASLGQQVFSELNISNFLGNTPISLSFNSPDDAGKAIYTGAVAKFSQDFGVFKSLGGGEKLQLTSESFLGKEPTRSECLRRICFAMEGTALGANCGGNFQTLFDNGC